MTSIPKGNPALLSFGKRYKNEFHNNFFSLGCGKVLMAKSESHRGQERKERLSSGSEVFTSEGGCLNGRMSRGRLVLTGHRG